MKLGNNLSRRSFFQWGAGMAGTLAATSSLANVCKSSTGPQGLGPFFPFPDTPEDPIRENPDGSVPIYLANDNDLTFVQGRKGQASGQVVQIKGQLTDNTCKPVSGATIIIWQASESGRYNHKGDDQNHDFEDPRNGKIIQRTLDPYFQAWGQATTGANGEYEFKTIVPGFYPANLEDEWYRPPHIHFMVLATGHEQFVTQMYFRGDEIIDNEFYQELNKKDSLLQRPDLSEEQREGLIVDFSRPSSHMDLIGQFNLVLP